MRIINNKNKLFIIALITLSVAHVHAASKKSNLPYNEPGFVTAALSEDAASNKKNSGNISAAYSANFDQEKKTSVKSDVPNKNSAFIKAGGTIPPNITKVNKKDNPSSKKNQKASSPSWAPKLGENKDSEDVILERQKEEANKANLVNKLSQLNYNIYVPPKELYNRPDDNLNTHLPYFYLESDYSKMVINSIDKDDYKSLRVLLENYKFINEQGANGDTILIYAIQNHKVQAARLLLSKGARVDAVNFRQRTALHYAAALGDKDSLILLLSMGANPESRDDLEMTSLDYAKKSGQPAAESILDQYVYKN